MTKIKLLAASAIAAGLLLGTQGSALAHCDSMDGPVAQAALAALENGNPNLVLPFAPAEAEGELKETHARAVKVRALGPEAKVLADRAFVETVVRLHRAGEGAPYTGLKPAGQDFGPAIPAAEQAIGSGDLSKVEALLGKEIAHGLEERFAHVLHTRNAPPAPQTSSEVPSARERVNAEFGFIAYVEGVRQAAAGAPGQEHRD